MSNDNEEDDTVEEEALEEDNVEWFGGTTTLDLPLEKIFETAQESVTENLIIIGDVEDARQLYFASTAGDVTKTLLRLEMAKRILMDNVMYGDGD